MKELREMTKAEVKALDGKMVINVYSDFEEKMSGRETKYDKKPFAIIALSCDKWYTDEDGLYIQKGEYTTNTVLDYICKGYSEEEASKMATNDKVTVTHIYKVV